MINNQFSSWPSYTVEEADAVHEVVLSNKVNYWTGNECRDFEKEFAIWSNSEYAVALGNGTLALDVAFKALNIGAGDEVIVTSRTFIASVSSIVTSGAVPIFAGTPKATTLSGIFLLTILCAPIIEFLPIETPGRIVV